MTIDGLLIDEVSSERLANGINLADYPNTPQYQQAMKIMYLNEERFEVEKRFREYLWTEYSFLKKEGITIPAACLYIHRQPRSDAIFRYIWSAECNA